MRVSHLYLLVEVGSEAFKIGKADDPTRRAAVLPNRINFGRSLAFAFPAQHVIRAEKTLHFLFRKHRLANRPRADGSTEWFRIEAFDDVKRFLWVNRALLGWTDWSIVEAPPERPGRPRSADFTLRAMTEAERAARVAEEQLAKEQRKEREARLKEATAAADALIAEAFTTRGLQRPKKGSPRRPKSGPVTRIDPRTGVKTITGPNNQR